MFVFVGLTLLPSGRKLNSCTGKFRLRMLRWLMPGWSFRKGVLPAQVFALWLSVWRTTKSLGGVFLPVVVFQVLVYLQTHPEFLFLRQFQGVSH